MNMIECGSKEIGAITELSVSFTFFEIHEQVAGEVLIAIWSVV